MARRRRPEEPIAEPEPERDLADLPPHVRVDPRLILIVPDAVLAEGEDAVNAWLVANHPAAIRTPEQIEAERDHIARQKAFSAARREARRRGEPMPSMREFFGDAP